MSIKNGENVDLDESIEPDGCCTLFLNGGSATVPRRISRKECAQEAARQGADRFEFNPGVDCPEDD
jgi:hypothetical protein